MAGGRPLAFESKEQLQEAINSYFDTETKCTLAGLAYHIGIDRQTLYNYSDEGHEFFDTIKRARERVSAIYEGRLIYDNNPTGVIFALKNMGWKDKQEIEQSGGLNITGFNYLPPHEADYSTK